MVCLCQRTKKLQPGHESIEKTYDFDLGIKGQGYIEVLMVIDTSSNGNTPMCQICYARVKEQRSYSPDSNLDLVVKGQGHIEFMNVLDTLSHGNTSMCQIWYAYIKQQKSYATDMYLWY